jgi:uncharacterized protein involved in exopolysaccharide biosynthesis
VKSARILFYNLRKALATVSLVFLLVVLFSVFWLKASPVYESKSVLTFLPTEFEIKFQDGRSDLAGLNAASVLTQTHTEFLLSRSLAESVIKRALEIRRPAAPKPSLALWVNQNLVAPAKGLFWKTYYTWNSGRFVEPDPLQDLTGKLMERTKIGNVPASYILSISVEWDDPEFARVLAGLLTEMYIENVTRSNEKAIDQTLAQLTERANIIQAQLDGINGRIRDFKKGEKLFVLAKTVEFKMDELKSYIEQHNEQRMKVLALQGELQNKKSLMTSTDYEKMKADLKLAQDLSKDLDALINGKQRELGAMPAKEFDFENLLIEKDNYRARLARVFDDIGMARQARAVGLEPIKIIDPPLASPYPKSPKILVNAAGGLILGLLLFLGWVLAEESFRPLVRSAQDLDPRLKHLGSLPPAPRPGGKKALPLPRPLAARPPSHLFLPHLRYLGERILEEGNPRVVVVDSLGAESARSELVDGLVQGPESVLIIDLEGRSGSLAWRKRVETNAPLTGPLNAPLISTLNALDSAKWRILSPLDGDAGKVRIEFAMEPRDFTPRDLRDVEAVLSKADPQCRVLIKPPPFRDFPMGHRLNRHADKVILMVSADATKVSQVEEYLDINRDTVEKTCSVLADVTFLPDLVFKA